jgi:hypothetical protein
MFLNKLEEDFEIDTSATRDWRIRNIDTLIAF